MSVTQKSLFLLKERVKEAESLLRKKTSLDTEKNIYLKSKINKDGNTIKSLNENLEEKKRMESKLQADLQSGKQSLINKIEANFSKELNNLKFRENNLQKKIKDANSQIKKLLKNPKKTTQTDVNKAKSLKLKINEFQEKHSELQKILKDEHLKINELEKSLGINQDYNQPDQTALESEFKVQETNNQEISDDLTVLLERVDTLNILIDKILTNYFGPEPIQDAMKVYKAILNSKEASKKPDDSFDRIVDENLKEKLEKYAQITNSAIQSVNKGLEEMRMKNLQLEIDEKSSKQDLENLEGQNKTNAGEYIGGASFFVSFSDVISVLLCFFVVFFAIGELDAQKFNKLLSTFSGDEIRPDIFNARVSNDEFAMLEKVKQLVHDNVDPKAIVQGKMKTIEHIISGSDLFAPGEVNISSDGIETLKQKIDLDLKNDVKQIIVEGHTDDKELALFPKVFKKYQNNLAFSAVRAGTVAQIIQKEFSSPKELINVTGYGENRPLKPNSSDVHRALNRRVVIKIIKPNLKNKTKLGKSTVQVETKK